MVFDKIKGVIGGNKGAGDLGALDLGGVGQYLDSVTYPVGIEDLLEALQANGAPANVVEAVKLVGQHGRSTFASAQDVLDSLGGAFAKA